MSQQKFDVANMRVHYDRDVLHESDLANTPLAQFNKWLAEVVELGGDVVPEPNAMVLSTSDEDGRISSRSVLLKGIDHRGLVFYTNYRSQKAKDIAAHPQVSALFPWYPMHRQVIVTGTVSQVSREEAQTYFATRPYKSQLGAIVSEQSSILESREILEERMAYLYKTFPEGSEVPMPEHWGGYRIQVDTMEFWQGRRSRLHDRLRYVRSTENVEKAAQHQLDNPHIWQVIRLSP